MSRVGVIGDPHEPFCHPMYRAFVQDTFRKNRIDHIHFVGDIVDNHALGFWDHDPDGMSAGDEADAALQTIAKWTKTFPKATVCIGNHDERPERVAHKYGLPRRNLKDYATVWETPGWKWAFEHIIDGVYLTHGTGTSGEDAAMKNAIRRMMSVAQGHTHAFAGVKYHCNPLFRVFGLNAGCGIDIDRYAFAYGKPFANRPVLGCGVVIDGEEAHFHPMPCGRGEAYHRSRAGVKKRVRYVARKK